MMPTTTEAPAAPKELVFRLSYNVWSLLGLDDQGLVAQSFPSFKQKYICTPSTGWFEASLDDAETILDDLRERAKDGSGGFEHNARERAALRRASLHVAEQIRAFKDD